MVALGTVITNLIFWPIFLFCAYWCCGFFIECCKCVGSCAGATFWELYPSRWLLSSTSSLSSTSLRQPSPRHPPPPPRPVGSRGLAELNSFNVPEKQSDQACPICLAPLSEEKVSLGPCLHLAHTSCLKNWLVTQPTCPLCRAPFNAAT